MINRGDITSVGHTIKAHGINGEIAAAIEPSVDLDHVRCLIMDIDGIYVPFFIESWRQRGSEAVLLSIDGIDDEDAAARLCGKTVFVLRDDIVDDGDDDGEGMYADELVGFAVVDQHDRKVGSVSGVDFSTENTLLEVTTIDGESILLPIAAELVYAIDADSATITMHIPEGLLDINA